MIPVLPLLEIKSNELTQLKGQVLGLMGAFPGNMLSLQVVF
jgi:hypothetical protein